MHSTYHRGQIAAAMRKAGATPAYTDFIHAVRQGFVESSSQEAQRRGRRGDGERDEGHRQPHPQVIAETEGDS